MIIFRPHRSTLEESMSNAKEFDNEAQMIKYITKNWEGFISVEDIVIDDKIFNDVRNSWKDTRHVCTKRMGNEKYDIPQCIGMCATDYVRP